MRTLFAIKEIIMRIEMINDFNNTSFQNAFKQYFNELGIFISDWKRLFNQMNEDKGNYAYLITDNNTIIGFIQFKTIILNNSFFEEQYGFIREFWIAEKHRNQGYGTKLLKLVEEFFINNKIYQVILTTATASVFYTKNGYKKNNSITAKNNDCVFTKKFETIA